MGLDLESISTNEDSRKQMSSNPEKRGALTKRQLEAFREALQLKRSEVLRQQNTQLSELHSPDKHHLADLEEMASDTTDTDSLCVLVDLGSSTISEIDKALEKIDHGSYGLCELCEKPIHPERLDVLPFASHCIECQRQKERQRLLEETEG